MRQVAVDDQDARNAIVKRDDPRLVDRVMRIGSDGSLDLNRTAENCGKVEWKALPKLKLSRLMARTFKRLPEDGRPRTPTLSDFGLPVHDQEVIPFQAVCHAGDGNAAPAPWGHAPWFVSLGNAKLAVAYDGAGVLLLDALPPTAPVLPSFDCQSAGSPTKRRSAVRRNWPASIEASRESTRACCRRLATRTVRRSSRNSRRG